MTFAAAGAWAGLGELRVLSGAGEPFFAEVPLSGEPGMENPYAHLASPQKYPSLPLFSEKASELKVTTLQVAPGQYVVKLAGPVLQAEEPLVFALELSWPSGKTVREYHLKGVPPVVPSDKKPEASLPIVERPAAPGLEVPAFGEARLLAIHAQSVSLEVDLLGKWPAGLTGADFRLKTPAGEMAESSIEVMQQHGRHWLLIKARTSSEPGSLAFLLDASVAGQTVQRQFHFDLPAEVTNTLRRPVAKKASHRLRYEVKGGDTLSGIAYRLAAPKQRAAMVATLLAANPKAFVAGNPDRLLAGAVLTIPSAVSLSADALRLGNPLHAEVAEARPSKGGADAVATHVAASEAEAEARQLLAQQKAEQLAAAQARMQALESEVQRLAHQRGQTEPLPTADQPPAGWDGLKDWLVYGVGGSAALGLLAWMVLRRRRAVTQAVIITEGASPAIAVDTTPDVSTDAATEALELTRPDVLAEVEVLLAYGRQAQALSLLNDALHAAPAREDIRRKLLELLASRRELAAFEAQALDVLASFGPHSPLWQHVQQLGSRLDAANPLYRHIAEPVSKQVVLANDLALPPLSGDEPVPIGRQVDSAEEAKALAELYREMGDEETAALLLQTPEMRTPA